MSDAEIGDLIIVIVQEAHQQIHVPDTSCKRRMSAYAVLMEQPFVEKHRGPALHRLDVGQLTENKNIEITFSTKSQSIGWFHLLPGFHAGTIARLSLSPCVGLTSPIRDGARPVPFIDMIMPLDHILDAVTHDSIDAICIKSLATLSHIHLVAEQVRHLRIDIDWSEVFAIDNLGFKRHSTMHPSAM
ncbi:hypothetical protein FGADI_10194 [Fusarium gaditjirri]|uniref:Uncharacterized protein n=1 Tax=Fusarium gaditjirri TaxID=282569 RepID=A0A8H4SYA7_9HYPO|nr:hypothetical protein FGADI_10194 [Fusarium gaditjirri]